MSSSNYIKNVAIVGAGGNSGSHMARELVATGKHVVTALTRADSTNTPPPGVLIKHISYSDPSTIVSALKDQDCLIITMSVFAGRANTEKLIRAAADAGIKWIMPNEWGIDHSGYPAVVADVPTFSGYGAQRALVQDLGVSSWIALTCGFWYEWSLSLPHCYGIDLLNHEATLYDDGETRISTSTWPQVGRAVAKILSLPIKPEGGDEGRCLERFRNGVVRVNSFTLTQKDMLASAMRVTGTKEDEWKVGYEGARERYERGVKEMKETGEVKPMAMMMYARCLSKDAGADFETVSGTHNEILGLEKEDVDVATKAALERAKIFKGGYVPAE